jgi:hypothetical protein
VNTTKKTTTTARKAHRCDFCGHTIPAGEEYHRQDVGPMDHPDNEGFSTVKAHADCWAMWLKVGDDFDWYFPESASDFLEAVTNAGYAVCCQTCEGNGRVEETEGTALPRRYYWPERGLNWTECPSCEGYGYRWGGRPVLTDKLKGTTPCPPTPAGSPPSCWAAWSWCNWS